MKLIRIIRWSKIWWTKTRKHLSHILSHRNLCTWNSPKETLNSRHTMATDFTKRTQTSRYGSISKPNKSTKNSISASHSTTPFWTTLLKITTVLISLKKCALFRLSRTNDKDVKKSIETTKCSSERSQRLKYSTVGLLSAPQYLSFQPISTHRNLPVARCWRKSQETRWVRL